MGNRLFGISKKATEAAVASRSFTLTPPDGSTAQPEAEVKQTDKGPVYRWTEEFTIVKAERSDKTLKNGAEAVQFYMQLKVRDLTSVNKQKVLHARYFIDFDALANESDQNEVMNNISIRTLKSLFDALGYELEDGEIGTDLLEMCFPEANDGTQSDLINKVVCGVMVDGPRRDKPAEREQRIDEFMPA